MLARSILVALMFTLLSAPTVLQRWLGGDTAPYVVTTIVLAAITIALVLSWPYEHHDQPLEVSSRTPATSGRSVWTAIVVVATGALLFVACRSWLDQILTIPLDPYRGDMLVIVREGVRRALEGHDPYTTYHIPWALPLPYGPMLWGPYALPILLRVDPRFLAVIGELFVPAACAAAAIASAARGRLAATAGALAMLGAIGLNQSLVQFTSVAHTPVYWPLLALFVWLTVRERWLAAAVLLGLLVVARLTMVAVVPVLMMAVWQIDRRRFGGVCVGIALATALPFLPFAIREPHALAYGLYGNYQNVIKTTVWTDATVPHTIGITGMLLTNHLSRFVEAAQVGIMVVVYAVIWMLLRRGRAPVPLMATALLVFSMTALWPVTYFYFDVFLMLAAAILIDMPWLDARSSASSLLGSWAAVAAVAVVLVTGFGATMLRLRVNQPPTVTWRDGPKLATIPLLRRTISPAIVDVSLGRGSVDAQRMTVALNGLPLGAVNLESGIEHVTLAIPASRWQLGANSLELSPEAPITFRQVIIRPTRSLTVARP
jgi:hypothetical protein